MGLTKLGYQRNADTTDGLHQKTSENVQSYLVRHNSNVMRLNGRLCRSHTAHSARVFFCKVDGLNIWKIISHRFNEGLSYKSRSWPEHILTFTWQQ